jgi:hypothetical protein
MLKILIIGISLISLLSASNLKKGNFIVMAPNTYQYADNQILNANAGKIFGSSIQNSQNAGNNDVTILGLDSTIKDIKVTTAQLNTSLYKK